MAGRRGIWEEVGNSSAVARKSWSGLTSFLALLETAEHAPL